MPDEIGARLDRSPDRNPDKTQTRYQPVPDLHCVTNNAVHHFEETHHELASRRHGARF